MNTVYMLYVHQAAGVVPTLFHRRLSCPQRLRYKTETQERDNTFS